MLMEILESREALEEAQAQSDVDSIREENAGAHRLRYPVIPVFMQWIARVVAVVSEIEEHIGARNWEAAHKAAVKLKYLEGIEQAAKSWPSAPFDH